MGIHPGISPQLDMTDRHADVVRDGYDAAFRVGYSDQYSLASRTLAHLEMAWSLRLRSKWLIGK
jgi:DNA-binding transcriptional LysR family regulator